MSTKMTRRAALPFAAGTVAGFGLGAMMFSEGESQDSAEEVIENIRYRIADLDRELEQDIDEERLREINLESAAIVAAANQLLQDNNQGVVEIMRHEEMREQYVAVLLEMQPVAKPLLQELHDGYQETDTLTPKMKAIHQEALSVNRRTVEELGGPMIIDIEELLKELQRRQRQHRNVPVGPGKFGPV